MDKTVIFAVAGSGKTREIIERLNADERFLLVTYTDNNYANIRSRITQKFGYVPDNIKLYTYFKFLYSFCYKPLLGGKLKARGINWEIPPQRTLLLKRSNPSFYLDGSKRLYHNRIAKLIEQVGALPDIFARLSKYFDHLFIDEVQDFGGHDLNFLCALTQADINILTVGDFFQHTFDTSKDGSINGNIYSDFSKYTSKLKESGFNIDDSSLTKSHRCSPNICNFIQRELKIGISSHRTDETAVHFIEDRADTDALFKDNTIVKLFYRDQSKYPCFSENWGKSKGQDHYQNVCLALNQKSLKAYRAGELCTLPSQTRNKLYVAITRARGSLFLVPEKNFKNYKAG